jgi:hypothetical protein
LGSTSLINQQLQGATQRPIFTNFGEPIALTRQWQAAERRVTAASSDICPYKGLRYFDWNEEDPKYFYGRSALNPPYPESRNIDENGKIWKTEFMS